MGTYRAAKVVSKRAFENSKPYERELAGIRRFEPVSRLHEGFVDILHVGINDSEEYFYYIMELGDDQTQGQTVDPNSYSPKTLAQEISLRGRLFLQECVQLGLGLSGALGELHSRGLVHRDIKPANIIFVNGIPKLADAGLVADVRDAPTYTGTKGYIPPEGPGTPQADIYSLGKVLYEAATGKDREEFPELPALPADPLENKRFLDLNEIMLEACQNDSSRRYHSAWDMHSDLQMIADNVSVREVKVLRRRLSRLKQVALVSAIVLFGLGSIGYLVYQDVRNRIDARQREIENNLNSANRALDAGDAGGSTPYYVRALRLETGPDGPIADRLRLGSALGQLPRLVGCWFPGVKVYDGEFSPDGTKIVIASDGDQTKVYDLEKDKLFVPPVGSSDGILSAAFSSDGRFITMASFSQFCFKCDLANSSEVTRWTQTSGIFSARFNDDGKCIVVAGGDGYAKVLDASTGECKLTLKHSGAVRFANFSHDGRKIVTASEDGTAQVWDALTGTPIGPPFKHDGLRVWVYFAAFSPDDQLVVTASSDRTAKVWKVGGGQVGPDLEHRFPVLSAEFSPDGRLILTASVDGTARLWKVRNFKPLPGNAVLIHGGPLSRAAFGADGRLVLTTSLEGKSIRLWDLAGIGSQPLPVQTAFNGQGTRSLLVSNETIVIRDAESEKLLAVCTNSGPPLRKAEFTRNGRYVLGTSELETNSHGIRLFFRFWDADTGKSVGPALPGAANSTAKLSEDGRRVVIFHNRIAELRDTASLAVLAGPLIRSAPISMVAFSPDGMRFAIAADTDVSLHTSSDGKELGEAMTHPVAVHHMVFSPDGEWLATCCQDDQINKWFCQVWNARNGRAEGGRLWHKDGVLYADFSPDSKRVVTAGEDNAAIIWDFHMGRQIGFTLEHAEKIETAAFSNDGKWVVTASDDATARVWDARTGYPLTPPMQHLEKLASAQFLADGRRIVTTDVAGSRRIWALEIEKHSFEELGQLARLLSGDSVSPTGGSGGETHESLQSIWTRLRREHPADFSTTPAEIDRWYASQAEGSEHESNWPAAIFHLKRLATRKPGDTDTARRLLHAQQQLQAARDGVVGRKNGESALK